MHLNPFVLIHVLWFDSLELDWLNLFLLDEHIVDWLFPKWEIGPIKLLYMKDSVLGL